ncbi:MAG: EAL domain-containing protein [Thauera sp.]|jgi:PAS domain S-box-containing protein|nr:EAL domain-containing protein [Thauera sp.]
MSAELRPASIRFRLLLASTTVQIVLLSLLLANSVRLMNNAANASLQTTVEQNTSMLHAIASSYGRQQGYAELERMLDESLADAEEGLIYVRVLDADSRELLRAGDWLQAGLSASTLDTDNASLPDLLREKTVHIRHPIVLADDRPGWLEFGISASSLLAAREAIISQGVGIAAAEILLTFILLSIIGYFLTRKLDALLRGSKAIAEGHLDHRIPDQGRDELSRIARHFNIMAQALQQRVSGLRLSQERHSLAIQGSSDGLWDWDIVANTVYFSDRFCEILGHPPGGLPPSPQGFLDHVHPADRAEYRERMIEHLQGRSNQFDMEHRTRLANGGYRWILTRGQMRRQDGERITRMAGSITDIDERKRAEQQWRQNALHDPLTGLPNRALFIELVNHALQRLRTRHKERLAVLVLRVSHTGHASGEPPSARQQSLCALAEHLRKRLPASTLIAHISEQELAIVLESLPDTDDALHLARSLIVTPDPGFPPDSPNPLPRSHIGIALSTDECLDADKLLQQAGRMLHRTYLHETGASAFFHDSIHAEALPFLPTASDDDEDGMINCEPSIDYLLIADLASAAAQGVEAQVRWPPAIAALQASASLSSITETIDLAHDLSLQALRAACADIQTQTELVDHPILPVHFRIPVSQLSRPTLLTELLAVTDRSGVPATRFNLEFSERQLRETASSCFATLFQLSKAGFNIVLADFGSGGASTLLLHDLPCNQLKLTADWAQGVLDTPRLQQLLTGLCQLAHRLDIKVVATAVDTPAQRDALLHAGCDRAQGKMFRAETTEAPSAEAQPSATAMP